ncbi:MAG: hypothetical protein CMP47_02275 [Rickettsiales bacterium]|nr:hypothetical protein [Rickettsiales bacterium]
MQSIKQKVPVFFLLVISGFWTYYYQSSTFLNDFGTAKPEWLLLIDGLIVLPVLCFIFIKDKKEAVLKAVAYSCLIILLGSFIIPESSKLIWNYLETGRYIALALFVVAEITTIITVIFAIKASLSIQQDPDLAISKPIEKIIGKGVISDILSFEARVWTYALFSKKIRRSNFVGCKHFSYHLKDGTQSNLLGFIIIILFELPIVHLLLHFIWSPLAANIVTLLTLLGLVFFFAEYRAVAIRPISIISDSLIIRYGIYNPLTVPLNHIDSVSYNSGYIPRASLVKRYNLAGTPNIELKLISGKLIYLGLDSPQAFIQELEFSLEQLR